MDKERYDLYWEDDMTPCYNIYPDKREPDYANLTANELIEKISVTYGWNYIVTKAGTSTVVICGTLTVHGNMED